jgi:hypothetical protein
MHRVGEPGDENRLPALYEGARSFCLVSFCLKRRPVAALIWFL